MDNIIQLMEIFIAQIDSSMKISKIISEHLNEKELSGDSVIIGLIYRLMTPMSQTEIDESIKKANDIINEEDSQSSDDELIEDEINIVNRTSRKLKKLTCNCDICIRARVCLINYHNYENQDQLSTMFNDAIKKTCNVNKIIL